MPSLDVAMETLMGGSRVSHSPGTGLGIRSTFGPMISHETPPPCIHLQVTNVRPRNAPHLIRSFPFRHLVRSTAVMHT